MILAGLVMLLIGAIGVLFFAPFDLSVFLRAIDLGVNKDLSGLLATVFFCVFIGGVLIFLHGVYSWITIMLDSQKRREWRERKWRKKAKKNARIRRKTALKYSDKYAHTIEFFLKTCAIYAGEVLGFDDDARIWIRVFGRDARIDGEEGSKVSLSVVANAIIGGAWEYVFYKDSLEGYCPRIEGEYGVDDTIKYEGVIEMAYIPRKKRIKTIREAVKQYNKEYPQYAIKLVSGKDCYARLIESTPKK